MEIRKLTPPYYSQWDDFVAGSSDANMAYLSGMSEVYARVYGFESLYLMAIDAEGKIVSGLAAIKIRKRRIRSLPFVCSEGFIFNENKNISRAQILEAFCDYFLHNNIDSVHITASRRLPFNEFSLASGQQLSFPVGLLDLSCYPTEQLLWKKLGSSARKGVKQAKRNGLVCKNECTADSMERIFYPFYLKAMRKFGTPPHCRKFFLELWEHTSRHLMLFVVEFKGRNIACLLGSALGDNIELHYTCSNPEFLHLRPNDLAHWSFISWAIANNYTRINFGPMKYRGQEQFKKKWCVASEQRFSCELHPSKDAGFQINIYKALSADSLSVKFSSTVLRNIPEVLFRLSGPCLRKCLMR